MDVSSKTKPLPLALVAALSLASCGGSASPSPSSTKPPPGKASVSADEAPTGESDVAASSTATGDRRRVQIEKPGVEPRQLLRYDLAPGSSSSIEMEMTMDTKVDINGVAQATRSPYMVSTFANTVGERIDDDRVRVAFDVLESHVREREGVPEAVHNAIAANYQMGGMKGAAVVDTRGHTSEASYVPPDNASLQVRQMLDSMTASIEQLSTPLPKEPVGIGAEWVVIQSPVLMGITVDQRVTMHLVERKGGVIHLEGTVSMSAPPQEAELPTLPGHPVQVRRFEGQGTVEIKLDLTHPMPVYMNNSVQVSSEIAVEEGGMTTVVRNDATTAITIKELSAKAAP